ncbi:MAG: DUF481 domain-containing protein, partial [Candidatus Latescibacterota bacterium]
MTMRWSHLALCLSGLLLLLPWQAPAQEGQDASATQASAATPRISRGAQLGPWWLLRSTKYPQRPPFWLYHVETTYEYTRNRGNFAQDVHEGTVRLVLRKGRFTPSLAYTVETRKMTLAAMKIDYQKHLVALDVTADLPKRVYASAGTMWNKDELVFVEKQFLYYGGLGYYFVDNNKVQLRAAGGLAYSDLESMFGAGSHNTTRFYVQELLLSPITPMVTIVQDLLFHRALDSDPTDFFWELRVPIIVKVAQFVSLVPVYKLKHDELYRP